MKLTTARLLDLAESGIGDTALRVYLTALTRMGESGADRLTMAALMNLPGLPRAPKALRRALVELVEGGLAGDDPDGAVHFVAPASDVSAKRALAGRLGGLAKASNRLASASGLPPPLPGALPETLPAGCQPDATDPSLSLIPSGSGSAVSSGSSALLSSGSGPESKPARGRRWRRVPADWAPNEGHRKLATELRVDLESQLGLYRDHEFKDPKSDPDATFRTWLKRAAEYHPPSGPGPRKPSGPGGSSLPVLMDRIQRMEAGDEGN